MNAEKLENNTLVRLKWVDSNFAKGWRHHEENTATLPVVVSVGYVTKCDDKLVELSSHVGLLDGAKLNPLTIPWGAIESVEKWGAKNGD